VKSFGLLDLNEDLLLKRYQAGESMNALRYEFHCGATTLKTWLTNRGCQTRDLILSHRKANFDETYFVQIDSHEKAYWLGFLYADGNIYQNKLQLGLALKDKGHISLFQEHIASNHKLYKDRDSYKLVIRSQKLVDSLGELGCLPRKSFTLKFPTKRQVQNQFINSFLLGYFDGDGCISIRSAECCWVFSLVGTKEFLETVKAILVPVVDSKVSLFKEARSFNNVWVLSVGGGFKTEKGKIKLRKLYEFLYEKSDFCLQRKREKFEKVLN